MGILDHRKIYIERDTHYIDSNALWRFAVYCVAILVTALRALVAIIIFLLSCIVLLHLNLPNHNFSAFLYLYF